MRALCFFTEYTADAAAHRLIGMIAHSGIPPAAMRSPVIYPPAMQTSFLGTYLSAIYHIKELFLREYRDAELLCFGELAACFLARYDVVGLL